MVIRFLSVITEQPLVILEIPFIICSPTYCLEGCQIKREETSFTECWKRLLLLCSGDENAALAVYI